MHILFVIIAAMVKCSCYAQTTGLLNAIPCLLNNVLFFLEHGESFSVDCNFCTCHGGNATCTNRQCLDNSDKKSLYTGTKVLWKM